MNKLTTFAMMMALAVGMMAQAHKEALPDVVSAPAPTQASNPNAPKLTLLEEAYAFGTIVEGPQATHEFKFRNDGKEPLVLSNVRASCGCTVPTWPKEPILPGKTSVITATYNTQGRVGPFTKTITIESNATEPSKVITIRGEVIRAEDDKSIPLAKPSMMAAPKN
ncbi:MAG: DUF1573 domain-containing protein [Chitinophagales bacterium]